MTPSRRHARALSPRRLLPVALASTTALVGGTVVSVRTTGASAALPVVRTGMVASVVADTLTVVNEQTGRRIVVGRGHISDPSFSHTGAYVAYLTPGPGGGELHVVRSAGGPTRARVPGVEHFSWSTTKDELAVSLARHVELVSATGAILRSWTLAGPGGLSFSPSGGELAVGAVFRGATGTTLVGRLVVLSTLGGRARVIAATPGTCQMVAGWTSDGADVLSWADPQCSASIAADGLELDAVAVRDARAHPLAVSLPDRSWVVPAGGSTVLINAGRDRIVADHKAVRACNAATGRCQQLPLPVGTTTLDPAVAIGARRLFVVRVPQSVRSDEVPVGTLWTSSLSGLGAQRVVAAGEPVADPVPSWDGSTVTFVRLMPSGPELVEVLDLASGRIHRVATVAPATFFGEFHAANVLAVWPGSYVPSADPLPAHRPLERRSPSRAREAALARVSAPDRRASSTTS